MSKKKKIEVPAEEFDYEGGFGGIPQDVDFGKNIGCGGGKKKKGKKSESK